MERFVIIHYAEIGLKGKNRILFEQALVRNIKLALEGLKYVGISRKAGCLLIKLSPGSEQPKIEQRLKHVFGIAYFSLAWACKLDLSSMKRAALQVMGDKSGPIRIATRRAWKGFSYNSIQVNEKIGQTLVKECGFKVNLSRPKSTLWIEILKDFALLYLRKIKGLGGLPVGISGKVICLLSGGIDSPVAVWKMLKRGCTAIPVHFYNEVAGGKKKILSLMEIFKKYQPSTSLYIVPFRQTQNAIIASVPSKYRMLIYRRFMFRIAAEIAKKEMARALVTGDSLGQVASQTLENLFATQTATDFLILRPLIGYDKQDIVDLAKIIGTYESSIKPYQDCCSYMIASHPVTKARLSDVQRVESNLQILSLVKKALAKAKKIRF